MALGKELSETSAAVVGPDLWAAYYREALKKYDRKLDYTTRAAENARLNAAVRAARSMFLPKYAKLYAEEGIYLNADAANFPGLRRDEIWHRRTWFEDRDGTVSVVLKDRPEEKRQTKTGRRRWC